MARKSGAAWDWRCHASWWTDDRANVDANAADMWGVVVEETVADAMASKVDAMAAKVDAMAAQFEALNHKVDAMAAKVDAMAAGVVNQTLPPRPPAPHQTRTSAIGGDTLPRGRSAPHQTDRSPPPRRLSLGAEVMAGNAMALAIPSGGGDPQYCIDRGLHGPSVGPVHTLLDRMSAVNGSKWIETYNVYQWNSHAISSVLFGWDTFAAAVNEKMMKHFSDFEFEAATQNKCNRFLKIQCKHCQSWTMVDYKKGTSGEEARSQVVSPLARFLCLEDASNPVTNDTV